MVEFFQNIGQWFTENKEAIVLFFSSIDFAALGAALFWLYKQKKSIEANTSETKQLNTLLKDSEQHNKDMEELKAENHELKLQVEGLKSNEDLLLVKLNAMLDVQSLVYATIKDESTRVAVNNILSNAKYNETATRNKLNTELEALRKKVAEQSKALEETVNKAVEQSEVLVNIDKPIVTRQ